MAVIFGILFVVFLFALIGGLKNPEKAISWNAEKTKKNVWKYFGSLTIVFFILMVLSMGGKSDSSTSNPRAIPGLAAVDVHGNLTSRGFTLESRYGDLINEWNCKRKEGNCDYVVQVLGSSDTAITRVDATISNYSGRSTRSLAAEFFGFLATLPYDGATPVEAKNWVQANVDRKAKKQFGPVVFETINYARWGRMLRITKAE